MSATDASPEARLRAAALALVQDERGVRVEDYLTTLAAVTGEAALASAGFDVGAHDLVPGSPLFYEPVNTVLTGDTVDEAAVPPGSVYGVIRAAAGATEVPTPRALYERVAGSVGGAGWGHVPLTVPPDHQPSVLPLRQAYELRDLVAGLGPVSDRATLASTALAAALAQVAGAIDAALAVRLALEVTFGMAKLAPMTPAALHP